MAKPAPIANIPEFHLAYNNGVTAAYIIHPRLLEIEGDKMLWKKPFLFTNKIPDRRDPFVLSNSRNERIVYAGNSSDLKQIWGRTGQSTSFGGAELPDFVNVRGYGRVNLNEIASSWVPFSFGIGHESDSIAFERGEQRVRTDWQQFKRGPLAQFDREKAAREAYESSLGYRVRTVLRLENQF